MNNPLLYDVNNPYYEQISIEDVKPAVELVLANNRKEQKRLLAQNNYSWDSLILPLQSLDNAFSKVWSPIEHLNAVKNSKELRDAYNECLPLISDYHTEIGQNKALYQAICSVRQNDKSLGDVQKKVLDDAIQYFELSGVALESDKKKRYKAISKQLSVLSSRYSDNVLDATNHWFKHITQRSELEGMPKNAIEQAAQEAKERGLDGWVITLAFPAFDAVVSYADNRSLRKTLYRAYVTRASDLGEKEAWDNSQLMVDILKLKQEMANLLGFESYAESSLETKMAPSVDDVVDFLKDLKDKSYQSGKNDYSSLVDYAKQALGLEHLEAWDVAYVREKQKEATIGYSEEDLKPWFEVESVLKGLFELVARLYNITITEKKDVETWHDDVRVYCVTDGNGKLCAQFYLDLYARKHKRGGAWMSDYCGRCVIDGQLQIPVANMTCNAMPPNKGKPALFTHDEVITLFHEFGHGLHHMLTQVDYLDISGINGVEWDAVELPSQFMENFCWEKEALDLFAKHHETQDTIPDDLFAKMTQAKTHQSGLQMLRQVEFSLFDMAIHSDTTIASSKQIQSILDTIRQDTAIIPSVDFNRFQHSFSHIFAGGYAAGYYSYKWAEVLSSDAYSRFEEEGIFNPETGKAFLQAVLEVGGSRKAMDSFIAFRGREPSIDALLRHSGIT